MTTEETQTNVMALPVRSTAGLDLMNLPERLDDNQMQALREIASEPLPEMEPAKPDFLRKALRMMFAVLPRRQSDDVSGELFVEAYERQLARYFEPQIQFLCDAAIERCRWFPTVAECHEICAEWRRNDKWVKRRQTALQAVYHEEHLRASNKTPAKEEVWRPTKEEIAQIHREVAESLRAQ